MAARVEALSEVDEDAEAFIQLDDLVELLEGLGDPRAPGLLGSALARRARLSLGHEERHGSAVDDAGRAARVLEQAGLEGEQLELAIEMLVLQGRLLALLGDEGASAPLLRAVALAERVQGPTRHLHLLRARRELAVARAMVDADEGAAELERADQLLREAPPDAIPPAELHVTISTRAEVLANGGRVDDALALLAARPPEEDWALVQRAATLDMAGRGEEAQEVGARLIDRLQERLDARDPGACHELADALVTQARRVGSDEDRAALTGRAIALLEEFNRLPARSLRLLCQALELHGLALDPPEAHEALRRRAHILGDLLRDLDAEVDRVELVRTFLQDGDVLLRMGQPHVARRSYTWAVEALEAFDDAAHPAVVGLLPLALNALGHALAACDLWLASRQRLDAAVAAVRQDLSAAGLANLCEVYLFRAIACVNCGDAEAAVAHLAADASPLLDAALREPRGSDPGRALLEAVVNMHVLRAEVLVDHLDRVDESAAAYDQALAMCDLLRDAQHTRASILGAKAAMLTERGRAEGALPLLRECVAVFRSAQEAADEHGRDGVDGELAQALVNLAASLNGIGEPRQALQPIQQADSILALGEEEEPPSEEGDDDDDAEATRQSIRSSMLQQRGEALSGIGHPLLAVDEFTRAIDICRSLVDEDGDGRYEASQQLPLALLLRARSWLAAGEHLEEAKHDLRESRRLYRRLFEDEARPVHGRRLEEVRALQRTLRGPLRRI